MDRSVTTAGAGHKCGQKGGAKAGEGKRGGGKEGAGGTKRGPAWGERASARQEWLKSEAAGYTQYPPSLRFCRGARGEKERCGS